MKKFAFSLAMLALIPSHSKATTNVVSGSVTRLESALILNYGSTPYVSSQTGPWISSVSRSTTGKIVITVSSGVFDAQPHCTCVTQSNSPGDCSIDNNVYQSATQVPVITSYDSAPEDYHFHIICHGSTE